MSSFADIDKNKWTENSCPSYGMNGEICFFEYDVHDHVDKSQLYINKEKLTFLQRTVL